MHSPTTFVATLALAPVLSHAGAAQVERALPFGPAEADGARPVDAAALAELARHRSVTLVDVALPDGTLADLELERRRVADGVLWIDGAPVPGRPIHRDVSLWAGVVAGEPDSEVFLTLAAAGSRGWVRRGGVTAHLVSRPDPARGWSESRARFATGVEFGGLTGRWECGANGLAAGRLTPTRAPVALEASGAPLLPLLECVIGVETDNQYFDVFGEVDAAVAYQLALFGAASERFRQQVGVILTMNYLNVWTTTDPWITPDVGLDFIGYTLEFAAAWDAGAAPVDSNLYFMASGAPMGAGVAFGSGTCSPDEGFLIATSMDGLTPFPIEQGPLNINVMGYLHELGHSFSSPHTHEYCPPLDECAAPSFWGPCQDEQVCQFGSNLSYCSNCPGFIANYTTFFHPTVIAKMRAFLDHASCLQPIDAVFGEDLGQALPGAGGPATLAVGLATPELLRATLTHTPFPLGGQLVLSPSLLEVPFAGGTLVPGYSLGIPVVAAGPGPVDVDVPLPPALALPSGATLYLQAWFLDAGAPFGLASTNGVAAELILAAAAPEPVWVPHPSNGKEYALTKTGTFAMAQAEAAANGAQLATIDSFALNLWLVGAFADAAQNRAVYIGLSDAATEGSFAWTSGSSATYSNWAPSQPNDASASGQDFVELLLQAEVSEETGAQTLAGQWNDTLGTGWLTARALLERPRP